MIVSKKESKKIPRAQTTVKPLIVPKSLWSPSTGSASSSSFGGLEPWKRKKSISISKNGKKTYHQLGVGYLTLSRTACVIASSLEPKKKKNTISSFIKQEKNKHTEGPHDTQWALVTSKMAGPWCGGVYCRWRAGTVAVIHWAMFRCGARGGSLAPFRESHFTFTWSVTHKRLINE